MPYTTRELLARLIKCEAGGEGDDGMAAVASVVRNRADVPYGEFFRVSQGGDIRKIIEQPGQFVCMRSTVGGEYNSQNVWNMDPGGNSLPNRGLGFGRQHLQRGRRQLVFL